MYFVRTYTKEIFVFLSILFLFFLSRFYNILDLPIFTDEAIYVRWAQIAKNDAAWRFISLTDGKQPSFIWFTIILMRFIDEPLLAARLVSVLAGFVSMIGLFFIGRELFNNRWIGILSSFLYLIFPMALVYDRMALYDSLVGMFAVWGFYFAILLVKKLRLDIALILGIVIGGGALTKTNGFFTLYLLLFTLILFNWTYKGLWARFFRWVGFAVVATILTYGIYSILRLSPFFHIIEQKNALFVYPFNEWLGHPFRFLWGNFYIGELQWLVQYITMPFLILAISSFFLSLKFMREKVLLFLWFLIPFILLALFGKVLYPRFVFFMTLSLLPLIAFSFYKIYGLIANRVIFIFIVIAVSFFSLRADYFILNDFSNAPIPYSDIGQYSTDWTAGGGVKEATAFFKQEAKNGKIFVATQGTFGLMPYAFEIYLGNNPNIQIKGYWPISNNVPLEVVEASKKIPTYFVFYQPCDLCKDIGLKPDSWQATLVAKYEKPIANRFLSIYKVTP